jgi:large subunit ribosomal protein L24
MSKTLKRDDEVVVIAGKSKGQRGKILQVLRKKNRVIVEGINMLKKHTRGTQDNPEGGIVEKEGSIHYSNVMLASTYDAKRTAK